MNRRPSQLVLGAFTLLAAMAGSIPASADHYRDINRLARRIDSTANSISREMKNFVHSPYHRPMVRDTVQLQRLACHIRDVARSGYDLPHLQSDILALGSAYRAFESRFYQVERIAPSCQNTRRVRRLLNSIQTDIQKMLVCVHNLLTQVYPQAYGSLHGIAPAPYVWNSGHAHSFGGAVHHDYVRNRLNAGYGRTGGDFRQPTMGHVRNQALLRSAELERQLRDNRFDFNPQSRSIQIGNAGSRITINY